MVSWSASGKLMGADTLCVVWDWGPRRMLPRRRAGFKIAVAGLVAARTVAGESIPQNILRHRRFDRIFKLSLSRADFYHDQIAVERGAALKVLKFNAGEDPQFASKFRVRSVPNFVIFKAGELMGQRTGFASKREILAWVDSAVAV